MGDELANLLKIFKRVEKDGGQATLSVSTNAGKTTIKLELTSSLSKPAPSLPSSSASGGRRRRHRGPAKKEKAKVRAALHQATLASTTASVAAAPSNPPPARPLRIHPSPPPASGRRRVTTTARQNVATFSSHTVSHVTLLVSSGKFMSGSAFPFWSAKGKFCFFVFRGA